MDGTSGANALRSWALLSLLAGALLVLSATMAQDSLAGFRELHSVSDNQFTTANWPTFSAVKDSYTKEDSATSNFGTETEMHIKPDGGKQRQSFVAFDISSIPSGSEVQSATLTLCYTKVADGHTNEIRRVLGSWDETAITWSNQPNVSSTVTASITVPATLSCVDSDVAVDVQAWVAGFVANHGWRISDPGPSNGESRFATREHGTTSQRPILQVVYGTCSDSTAPAAPTGLTATAGENITLDWDDNTEGDLAGYNVYRSTTPGGPYTKIKGVVASAYVDTSASGGTTYYYVVTAGDNCGNESANSGEASARADSTLNLQENDTEMSTATSPTGNIDTNNGDTDSFTATSPVSWASNESDWSLVLVLRDKPDQDAPATVNVWWQNGGACSDGAVAGQIFATGSVTVPTASSDGLGTTVTVPKAGGTVDHTFGSGDELCLSIRADGSGGAEDLHYYANIESTSGSSGVSRLRGPFSLDDTLDPPTNVSASATQNIGEIDLSWTATVDAYADGYRIFRSTTSSGPYTQIAEVTPQSATSYLDSTAECGTTYYYVIRSFWNSTESANSAEASATDSCTSLTSTADTYVQEDNATANFGTDIEMKVKADPTKRRHVLFAFDVSSIPAGSTVHDAVLTLCLSAAPGGGAQGRTNELRRVTSSWAETSVTWNTRPTASGTVTDTITVPSVQQCVTFSVTADVQAWVDGTTNHGWRINFFDETTNSGDVKYRTREDGTTSERPKLEVSYTAP